MELLQSSEVPAPDSAPRKVLLRRPLQAMPSSSEIPSEESALGATSVERRKVLLAHKIKPGQTIQLKAREATATMRDDGDPQLQAESLITAETSPPKGPKYGPDGMLLSFSVLGPVEEFAEQLEGGDMGGEAAVSSRSVRMEHPMLDHLDALEASAANKSHSASQRQMTAEALARRQSKTWKYEMETLARTLNVEPSNLMMARTMEHRQRMQQREVLEALRRRQHPYGGDRAWQIGLRNGGVFYEAIGNPSNGIFCPFRAPNDAEALARAGTLGLSAHEPGDLSLAALESKILGEQQQHARDELENAAAAAAEERDQHTGAPPPAYNEQPDDDDDWIDPEAFDVVNAEHLKEIERLRDKYNIEGAAPGHLSGDQRVLWGIFKEIDTDESGSVSKQELYAAFAKMGLVASAAEMLRLFREGDLDGNGRIDCDEFIALGQKVDVFAGAAEAFSNKGNNPKLTKRRSQRHSINKGSQKGPILYVDTDHLAFEVGVNARLEKAVEMSNEGSTAMYYEWVRSPVSAGLGTSCASDAAAQFFAPSAKGCILPDTKVAMRFAFQPSKPGIFTEEWHLRLTPAPKVPVKPVLMRGVCLEAPERQHQVRTLQAELARRRTWFAVQDILERDVLDSVFRTTIPDGVRVDAVLTPSTAPAPAAPDAAADAAAQAEAEEAARFGLFLSSYATPQGLPPAVAKKAFDEIVSLAAAVPLPPPEGSAAPAVELEGGEEGAPEAAAEAEAEEAAPAAPPPAPPPVVYGVPFSGDPYELEETLSTALAGTPDGGQWLARLEQALHRAASATPSVSKAARMRHAAADCALKALYEGVDAVEMTRMLYGKPTSGVTAPEAAAGGGMTIGGVEMAWVWETETYEKASEAAEIGEKAYAARKAKEREAAEKEAWEAKKAAMSKRDRKKAEKAEEAAAAAAAVAAAPGAAPEATAVEPPSVVAGAAEACGVKTRRWSSGCSSACVAR